MMRTSSLRILLMKMLVLVVLAPIIAWLGTIIVVKGPMKTQASPWQREVNTAVAETTTLLQARPHDWSSPAFHQELERWLERGHLSVLLLTPEGRPIYQYGPRIGYFSNRPPYRVVSASDNQSLGFVYDTTGAAVGIYVLVASGVDPLVFWLLSAAIGAVVLATGLSVWWMGRSISVPLQALALAAHQVHEGQLEFNVPTSRVRELNELSRAFAAMRDGLKSSLYQQASMELERRMLIAAIAHDLRTPLSSVRGYLEGLRDGVARTPEQVERYIEVALDKAGALERLIESFFAFTRTEYLNQPPQREALDLPDLLEGAVQAIRPRAEAAAIQVVVEGSPNGPLFHGDRTMLTRVIDNLLDNALRFTPTGGRVTVGWTRAPESFTFWVQDTGPGIPPADLGRVFQPLYRGDKARGSHLGGAGLGLAIAQRLVVAHGGSIQVMNHLGARFTAVLPTLEPFEVRGTMDLSS